MSPCSKYRRSGDSMKEELLSLLGSDRNGVSESAIRERFGANYESMVPILNELLGSNRVQLFTQSNGDMIFRLVDEDKAVKMIGLTHEQILVYQEIEKAKNLAIWSGDIRRKLNMPTQSIDKTLKILLNRGLVKLTRDVNRKNRKIYILSELEPAKEISGGPWYTDHEFDSEFIQVLSSSILKIIRELTSGSSSAPVGMAVIHERIRKSGITNVNITPEEFGLLLQSLVFDGHIEEASIGISGGSNGSGSSNGSSIGYKLARPVRPLNYLSASPCGICPVSNQCSEEGVISPSTCEYMTAWLAMADDLF